MRKVLSQALAEAADALDIDVLAVDDPEILREIDNIRDMLSYLSKSSSSPLFEELKTSVNSSGGTGSKRAQKEIVVALAAFKILCGSTLSSAIDFSVEACGTSSRSALKRDLQGAVNPDALRRLGVWGAIERRLMSVERSVQMEGFILPRTREDAWEDRVVTFLVHEARSDNPRILE